MPGYNGHKNWTHWNVSLWINNDEGLYNLARDCRRTYRRDLKAASRLFMDAVQSPKTPDGARYSVTSVAAAIRDL